MQTTRWKEFVAGSKFVDFLLVTVAIIWGMGFPMTQAAVNADMGPGLIVAVRFTVAAIFMFFVFFREIKTIVRTELPYAIVAGVLIAAGFLLQTVGIKYTTPSNNAFLTSTGVIMVPFLGWVFFKQQPGKKLWLLAFTSFLGAAFLTLNPQAPLVFAFGDVLTLLCAVVFSLHVVYLGAIAGKISAIKLAFIQMAVSAITGWGYVLLAERQALATANWGKGLPPTLYLAFFSTAYAFLVQTYAQSRTSPTKTSIILSAEGLLGSIFSVALGFELLTIRMLVGGLIIFASLVFMELNPRKLKTAEKEILPPPPVAKE